jgi:hypothetical protein
MARSSRAAERATGGFVLLIVAVLFWLSNERRLAIFVALALFVPYVAVIAPFKCGGYTRQRQACRLIGCGLLIGCHHHRFDRLGRIFGHDRDRSAGRYRYPEPRAGGMPSAGMPEKRSAGEPTRLKAFDVLSFVISLAGMIAGWLALWIGPS